jgi:membrane-bound lytic murein transglycosylase D
VKYNKNFYMKNNIVFAGLGFVVGIVTIFLGITLSSSTDKKTINAPKDNYLPQKIVSIDLNRSFSFADESLDLNNPDVVQRLDRELMTNAYLSATTITNIKRAYILFPIIEPILRDYNIPDDFKYLCVAESNLMNLTSPASAKGYWQFLKGTAKDYGLEVTESVDERYNIEKSTTAACKHLLRLKNMFGSWMLVAASYNMGEGGLKREVALQQSNKYLDLDLNQETSRYVFRIIAIKDVMQNSEKYGFYIDPKHNYPSYTNVSMSSISQTSINWLDIAKSNNISYRLLVFYNPWIISPILDNKLGKTYTYKIPNA